MMMLRMNGIVACLVAPVIGLCGQIAVEKVEAPESVASCKQDLAWVQRISLRCGPNSLYAILRLYGIPVETHAIEQYAPSHPKGMSLAELQDACGDLGLPVHVRQCSISDMCAAFRSPLIAYTYYVNGEGHYTIILDVRGDQIHILDAATGRVSVTTPARLANIWQGYVLVPKLGGDNFRFALGISMLVWLTVACAIRCIPATSRLVSGSSERA
jgi:hypothetical protein